MNITEADKAVIDRLYAQRQSMPSFWFLSSLNWLAVAAVMLVPYPAEPGKVATAIGWMMAGVGIARLGRWLSCLIERTAP